MKLIDMSLREYAAELGSKSPAPGGGSVSALAGAQGVALAAMVMDLTIGKERYAEYQDVCLKYKKEADDLLEKLLGKIDEDTEAYLKVSKAFQMPKDSEEAKKIRSEAIKQATIGATEVPFSVMQLCSQGIDIVKAVYGKSNPNAVSDLGVAADNLLSAMRGAWLNVKINLPGLKDEGLQAKFADAGMDLLAKYHDIAKDIYDSVEENL